MKFTPQILFCFLLFFSACKDEEPPVNACTLATFEAILEDGNWKANEVTATVSDIVMEGVEGLELKVIASSNLGSSIQFTLKNFEGDGTSILLKDYSVVALNNFCLETPSGQFVCDGVTMNYQVSGVDSYISYDAPGKVKITSFDTNEKTLGGTFDIWVRNFGEELQLVGSFNGVCW